MIFRAALRFGDSFPDSSVTPWPLGKLKIDKESIELSVPWRTIRLPRKHISRLLETQGLMGIGLRIEHHVLEEPNVIVFWTRKAPEVAQCLLDSNYPLPLKR